VIKRIPEISPVNKLLKVQKPKTVSVNSRKAGLMKARKSQTGGSSQQRSQRLRIINGHGGHDASSYGGGIQTNRSIKTQRSKTSQRPKINPVGTLNQSMSHRSLMSRKSAKQLSQNDKYDLKSGKEIRMNQRKKVKKVLDFQYDSKSLMSLKSEKI
jgi:hypothetical protein